MTRFRIFNFVDKSFVSFCIFLLLYAWINFYIRNLNISFIFSLILTISISYLLYHYLNGKSKTKNENKKIIKDIEDNFLAFSLFNLSDKLSFIKTLIGSDYSVASKNNYLFYEQEGKRHIIKIASKDILSQSELINELSELPLNKVDIIELICEYPNANLNTNIFKSKRIILTDKTKLYYDYFVRYGIFPDKTELNLTAPKISFREIIRNATTKDKAKSYFWCGLVLLFTSIIIPYHIYYLIMGSILIILSIISKVNPLIEKHKSHREPK